MPSFAVLLALLLAATCGASSVAPRGRPARPGSADNLRGPARPGSADKLLALRGGDAKSVVLALNAAVTTAYGIGCTVAPTQVMMIYGHSGNAIAFMDAGHALSQYIGGMQAVLGLRCLSALTGVGVAGFPACKPKEVLEEMFTVHAGAAAIAAYRAWRGSQISLLAAMATPLPGSILFAGLSYWGARQCAA